MPTILKPIAAILLAVPLFAQSPIVARRINPLPNFMPGGIERRASGYMLHVGGSSEPLRASLQSLLGAPELAEMKIVFESVAQNTPLYPQLAKEIGMQIGSKWALTDATGRLVAQGTEAPKAADLRKAMDDAGMKSPIQRLREFLKANPDNLDARLDLLNILLETAEADTKKALQLNVLTPAESRRARDESSNTKSLIFDLAPLEGKELDSSEDAKIWGPYAVELDVLFTNGDWRLLRLPIVFKVPLEAASPTMAQLYRRHLPKIESALEERPDDIYLWHVYGLAHAVARRGSVRALVDRLVPAPWQESSWPDDDVFELLMSEERAKGNWGAVAQEMWSKWPALKYTAWFSVEDMKSLYDSANIQKDIANRIVSDKAAQIMKDNLVPLVESLIKAGRTQDAETVLTDIAVLPDYRGFQRMAANAALKCGRDDLSQKWLALEIPIILKAKADKDYFDMMVKSLGGYTPVLVVANGKQHEDKLNAMLEQSPLSDWGLRYNFLNPELSEIMNRGYGLPDKETNWLLVGSDGKTIQSGSGLPTPDALAKALINSPTPTTADAERRFVLAHPSHYQAKGDFLITLQGIAEKKTKDKLGEGAGKNRALVLSEKDDEDIWGEYARVFQQYFSYHLEQSGPEPATMMFSSLSIHSPKMKALAAQYLPRVESALKRQPISDDWWGWWFSLCPLSERADFKTFRESLAMPPLRHLMESPSTYSLRELWWREDLPAIGPFDWQMAADVFSWVAEAWRPIFEATPEEMTSGRWELVFKPLLESYLHLDKDSEASALIEWWSASPSWGRIKPGAVDLAKKYGKSELAEKWGKM